MSSVQRAMRVLLSAFVLSACTSDQAPAPATPTTPSPPTHADAAAPSASNNASAPVETSFTAPPPMAPDAGAWWSAVAPVPACKGTAIVLVIDRSGSMAGTPIEMAKEAARRSAAVLGAGDCFEIIAFDSRPYRLVALAPLDAKAYSMGIDGLTSGGGTEIFSALDAAAADMRAAKNAARRAIVLLTDGQAPEGGIRELVDNLARERVVVSTIGLGSGVDEKLLRGIAEKGAGRFAKVMDPTTLPAVMHAEVQRLSRR